MGSKRPASVHDGASKRVRTEDGGEKSQTQYVPLSEEATNELRDWLDAQEKKSDGPVFRITQPTLKQAKSMRKNHSTPVRMQHLSLNKDIHSKLLYTISPYDRWLNLKVFPGFNLGKGKDERISKGSCIFVKHTTEDLPAYEKAIDPKDDWKCFVHEIRALDETHVYLRVTWLENPDELERVGRQPYHGRNELVPSSHMEIIDAMTANGSLQVRYWDEEDDDAPMPDSDEFFWRQTFDHKSKVLSKLHGICKCGEPQNPDKLIIQCSREECGTWLHDSCLAEEAIKRLKRDAERQEDEPIPKTPNGKTPNGKANTSRRRHKSKPEDKHKDEEGTKSTESGMAEVLLRDNGPPTIRTNDKGTVTEKRIRCLVCGHKID